MAENEAKIAEFDAKVQEFLNTPWEMPEEEPMPAEAVVLATKGVESNNSYAYGFAAIGAVAAAAAGIALYNKK
jgi:hypothetical protein